jgi:hypothetical protein
MIHVLVNCPNPNDATSFYRGYGPLLRMSKKNQICFIPNDGMKNTWVTMRMADVVFMQRPFSDTHLDLACLAKSCNKPLVIDFDDDLFNVPLDNPSQSIYNNDEVRKRVATIIGLADHVIVSTEKLKEIYGLYNQNITVINNAWDSELMTAPIYKNSHTAMWRGSNSHVKDLFHVKDRLTDLIKENDNYEFEFIGYNPWFIAEKCKLKSTDGKTLEHYFKYIKRVSPRLVHVPLVYNEFNESKSNIAWIEATHASAICLAPDMPEWRKEGIINYTDINDYKKKAQAIIDGKLGHDCVKRSYENIMENFNLDKMNMLRLAIFSEMREKNV